MLLGSFIIYIANFCFMTLEQIYASDLGVCRTDTIYKHRRALWDQLFLVQDRDRVSARSGPLGRYWDSNKLGPKSGTGLGLK